MVGFVIAHTPPRNGRSRVLNSIDGDGIPPRTAGASRLMMPANSRLRKVWARVRAVMLPGFDIARIGFICISLPLHSSARPRRTVSDCNALFDACRERLRDFATARGRAGMPGLLAAQVPTHGALHLQREGRSCLYCCRCLCRCGVPARIGGSCFAIEPIGVIHERQPANSIRS